MSSSCQCQGNCSCGSSCQCGKGSKRSGMYPDVEKSSTATLIHGLAPANMSYSEGSEMEIGGDEGGDHGCKCGSNCKCTNCTCT